METTLTADREARQVTVAVDGRVVSVWNGFASTEGVFAFAQSLLHHAVGVRGRHLLKSVRALEHAQEAAEHPEWGRNAGCPVADLRGLVQQDSDDVAVVVWSRVD